MMKFSLRRKATMAAMIQLTMLGSMTYGIMSARRQNWAYQIYCRVVSMRKTQDGRCSLTKKMPRQCRQALKSLFTKRYLATGRTFKATKLTSY